MATSHLPCMRTSYWTPGPHTTPPPSAPCSMLRRTCAVPRVSNISTLVRPDRLKKLEFGPRMHPHRAQYEIYHKWGYAEADRKCDGGMNLIPTPHPCFNVASSDPGVRPRAPRANIDTGGRGKGGSDDERFE